MKMKNLKKIASALFGAAIMCLITLAIILYCEGYYDISFIDRKTTVEVMKGAVTCFI